MTNCHATETQSPLRKMALDASRKKQRSDLQVQ